MQAKTGRLCCSGTNGLSTSDFGSSTRGERYNSYYADHNMLTPPPHVAHLLVFEIFVGRDPKRLNGRISYSSTPWSNLNFRLTLFQNPQIIRMIFSGHDIIHPPALFPVWGFIMTMVIVISFAIERKTVLNDDAPELRGQPNWMIKYN